jgi:hypothetical protein
LTCARQCPRYALSQQLETKRNISRFPRLLHSLLQTAREFLTAYFLKILIGVFQQFADSVTLAKMVLGRIVCACGSATENVQRAMAHTEAGDRSENGVTLREENDKPGISSSGWRCVKNTVWRRRNSRIACRVGRRPSPRRRYV